MRKIGVAILGLGTVGGGTYEILVRNAEYYKKTQELDVTVENVLDKSKERLEALKVPKSIIAKDLNEVVCNPAVDVVVEVIGGVGFAKEAIIQSLMHGKTVVTANKELVAKCWTELEQTAKAHNAGLYFEASCVGGVPIIRTLTDGMQANKIESLYGIINGTTNYILTKMADEGKDYDEALKEAQSLGFAEFNPTADVDGYDASYKLSILASLAFHKHAPLEFIFREGISKITSEDIEYGKRLGYTVKLLAIGKNVDSKMELRVHPTFIPNSHPLASIKGSFNAVLLNGDAVGEIMLYGKGAGALPTGSAIVSDIIYAAKYLDVGHCYHRYVLKETEKVAVNKDFKTSYYVRILAKDKAGVLAKVGGIFAKADVSIKEVIQSGEAKCGEATLVITTHLTEESRMNKAIALINDYAEISKLCAVIRIEN